MAESARLESSEILLRIREEAQMGWRELAKLFGVSELTVQSWALAESWTEARPKIPAAAEALLREIEPLLSGGDLRSQILAPAPGTSRSLLDAIRSRRASSPEDINRPVEPSGWL